MLISNKKVLITNGSSRTSYAVMRSLGKKDINCMSADVSKLGMCQLSRYSKGSRKYASFYLDEMKFIRDVLKIIKENDISILFPSHNETEIISRHIDKFDPKVVSLIPEESICRLFNNKSLSYDLMEELDIPVPLRIKYKDPLELSNIISSLGLKKTVIKLLTGNSGKGVFYADSPDKASIIVASLIKKFNLKSDRYPQVEEYVEGEGYGNSVLFWHGEPIVNFTHRRLRDKIETGGTSTFREVSQHKGIEAAALKIFRHVGWHGLAMSEFKVCRNTGKFWFIEVNPRMWGSISLAIESGVDFPYLTYLSAIEGPQTAINYLESSKISKEWSARWLLGDIFVILKKIINLDIKFIWNVFFYEKANSIDDFFWDDPLVFVGQCASYIKTTILKKSLNPSEKGMIG